MKKERIKKAFTHPLILVVGILLGIYYQDFRYNDICLDLGGGKNPGNHSICVLEKAPEGNRYVVKEGDEFVCDERGNIFKNADEASKFYQDPGAYGATYCQYFEDEEENKTAGELEERLKKLGLKIEKTFDENSGKEYNETVFPGINSMQNIKPALREYFREKITGGRDDIGAGEIRKNFPGIREEDFKNTGHLKYQADFDILLFNILTRTGLEPINGQQIDELIDDLKKEK